MFVPDLLTAFLIAFVIALIVVGLFGWRRPGAGEGEGIAAAIVFFFFILFLATWAGGAWVRPVGTPMWGVSWLGFLFIAIIVALLLMAAAEPNYGAQTRGRNLPPPDRRVEPGEPVTTNEEAAAAAAGISIFFWILLIFLIIAIIAAYI